MLLQFFARRSRPKRKPIHRQMALLQVECLDTRDSPSTALSLTPTPLDIGQTATLSAEVETAAFDSLVSEPAGTDKESNSATGDEELGTCPKTTADGSTAQAGSAQMEASDSGAIGFLPCPIIIIANTAPTIDLTATEIPLGFYRLSGNVTDEIPAGMVVRFAGLPSVDGKSAVVDAEGKFSTLVKLNPGENGTVTAQTTDAMGLDSNIAWDIVRQTE